jgi:urease accessory protein
MSGLTHPIFGLDHLIAMLAVGIVSVQMGDKYIFRVPLIFVIAMVVGAAVGLAGYSVSFVEEGISLSVLLLGTAIVIVKSDKYVLGIMAFVAYFGFLHGYAHGAEMPESIGPIYYGGGFLTSTVAIHLLGVGLAHLFKAKNGLYSYLRIVGVGMACVGAVFLLNSIG